ncbi:secretion system X translation initiation factor [Pseudomonas sp. NPDC078700]|uniref:secretion system X translation initiation factor n=1 Tax=Pseudomonas sp. NPDC078700 TaxID=3364424 RepID=UPI0037C8BC67
MNKRMLCWAGFISAAILVAVIPEYFFSTEDEPVVQPRGPANKSAIEPVVAPAHSVASAVAPGAVANVPQRDLFAVHSWRIVPTYRPVVVAPVAPVVYRPVAPPLPFQFVGKLDDSVHLQVFLQEGEQVHVVRVGDVIGGTYKVEKITQSNMTLLYLPLKVSQSMAVGSTL